MTTRLQGHGPGGRRSKWLAVLPAVGAIALGSCLGEPEVDERWTLLEMAAVYPQPNQAQSAGQPLNVSVTGRVTYRDIVTGFMVAEVRYSPTLTPLSLPLDIDEHTEECAASVDQILANSVTAGRATRAITGWDHLMQDVNLSFTAAVPPAVQDNMSSYNHINPPVMPVAFRQAVICASTSLAVLPWAQPPPFLLHMPGCTFSPPK